MICLATIVRCLLIGALLTSSSAFGMKERIRTFMSKHALLDAKFLKAAKKGDSTTIEKLLSQIPNAVHVVDKLGNTALHLAAGEGYDAIITLLVRQGALVNAKNAQGETPLHAAALGGWSASITLLAAQGALINAQSAHGNTPLHFAVLDKWDMATKALLACKPDINIQNGALDTPLHLLSSLYATWSIGEANSKVTQLLKAGARIDIRNAKGKLSCDHSDPIIAQHIYTPLVQAVDVRDHCTTQRLLAQGADPNFELKDIEGNNHHVPCLLNIATFWHDNAKGVCMLLDAGADPTKESVNYTVNTLLGIKSVLHDSAVTYALKYSGGLEMAELLITHVPRWPTRKQIKEIAFPLLLCLNRLRKFPQDLRKMLCKYSIAPAILKHQHERATTICSQLEPNKLEFDDFAEIVNKFDPAQVSQYYPVWQTQIHHALQGAPKGPT